MKSDLPHSDPFSSPRADPGGLGPAFWLASAWIVLVAALALFADTLPLRAPDRMDWQAFTAEPGTRIDAPPRDTNDPGPQGPAVYLLGTDTLGRDIFSRLVFGARVSLTVGILSPAIGGMIGALLGMLAGFYRGRLDTLIVGVMDVILAFPGLVLLLAVSAYLGGGLGNLVLALGFLVIPAFTRVARAQTLALMEKEFIQAARMLGAGDVRILLHEVLPNITLPLMVYGLYLVAVVIVVEGALSFLGLSVPPPAPSWGGMVAEGKEVLDVSPHVSLFPALAMFTTILAFNLMADALRGITGSGENQI
jgi:peptide/nickel transport system permease protein